MDLEFYGVKYRLSLIKSIYMIKSNWYMSPVHVRKIDPIEV